MSSWDFEFHSLQSDLRLIGYSDVDWINDRDEHKPTTRYAFLLSGATISLCSKKQSCIALSMMELEYVACSATVQEVVWLRRFFRIYSDSMTALVYAKDPKYHGRIKHINIGFHYICDVSARRGNPPTYL